jgi:ribonuclease D
MSSAKPEHHLINTQRELDELVAHVRNCGTFAFDTEFIPEETYEPELCLIQVATVDRLAVVDPRVIPKLSVFWDAVVDPAMRVVVHAGSEDLRICNLQTDRLPERVFDIQLAAGLAGSAYPASLGVLVQRTLGRSVLSSETRTDWRKRPLTPNQIEYALDDVRYLLSIAEILENKLRELGRLSWLEEETALLMSEIAMRDSPERWTRISGIHTLNRRGLEIARRLYRWRLETAQANNRPVRQLIRDDLLIGIAKRQPKSRADLENLRDFNRPGLIKASGEIMRIVDEARQLPDNELPALPERVDDLPGASMLVGILTAALAYACNKAQVSQALVATMGDLKDLVRWSLDGRDPNDLPVLLQTWRADLCGQLLMDVLDGKKKMRVSDPSSAVPITIE